MNPYGENPSPDSDKWMFRYYHQDPYGSVGNILLEQGVPSRYVAVFCAHNEDLALAEVKIYPFSEYIYFSCILKCPRVNYIDVYCL